MYTRTGFHPLCGALLSCMLAVFPNPASAVNDAMLDLLTMLRDKGTLTQQEYDSLVAAARSGANDAAGTSSASSPAPGSMPESWWPARTRIKGDLRLRYQNQDETGSSDRGRGRLRYRLGVVSNLDKLEIGAGLASGGGDLRSTNQSFDGSFSTKSINLDYAYAQYDFGAGFKGIGGKFPFKNYLWTTTDLMWDSDIRPEGAALNFATGNALGKAFINSGLFVLEEESSSSEDAYMGFIQVGQRFGNDRWRGGLAGAYYAFGDVNPLTGTTGNVNEGGTNTDFRFDSFGISGELATDIGPGTAGLFSDVVFNTDTDSSEDTGFAVGAGYAWDAWRLKYIYANLDDNAWPDFLPDSDRFDGLTGIRGHEFIVQYKLFKNLTLGIDYYRAEDKGTNADQDLVQFDVEMKF